MEATTMGSPNFWGKTPDRQETNDSDGKTFYGFDSDDGTTTWYDKDGSLDSVTDTPDD